MRSVRRHVIDRLDRADIAAMARIFGAIRDGAAPTTGRRVPDDRAAPRLRLPRRQRRGQGRHRRPRRHRRRPAGRRRRRVHPQPVRRTQRDDQPRAPRRRAGPGDRRSCRRTPTSPTARPAAPTPRRSSPPSPTRLGCAPADVLVASTGVIGRRYPIERILAGVAADAAAPGRRRRPSRGRGGIMTTDTVAKVAAGHGRRRAGDGSSASPRASG